MPLLLTLLPEKSRAWALLECFLEQGEAQFITRHELIDQTMAPIYDFLGGKAPSGSHAPFSPHRLAVLFLAFSLGSLVDLNSLPDSEEADQYYELGRAAVSLQSIFTTTELSTVQALALMSTYHLQGNRRYSADEAWQLLGLSARLAQSVRNLHCYVTYKLIHSQIGLRTTSFTILVEVSKHPHRQGQSSVEFRSRHSSTPTTFVLANSDPRHAFGQY